MKELYVNELDSVGEFDAQRAGHGVILRGEVGNWQDLTLAPQSTSSPSSEITLC